MSTIKLKTGPCIDCDSAAQHQPLTAMRCQFHYWKYRNQVKADERKAKGVYEDKYAQKQALDLWFHSQIQHMPKCCENCGAPLYAFSKWAAKAYIAHILPKRHFKSVQTHPLNCIFLCLQCHANYDNRSMAKVKLMPVFKIAVERLLTFWHECQSHELLHLPGCFVDELTP